MENIVVLFKSNEGVFSGFLAKPFWDDPYQLPVAIGNYSYEKEDAQNFVNIIMNSDVGFRHGSTRLEKLANIESLDNINDCIEKAKEITGLEQLHTLYVYHDYQWQEGYLFETEPELKLKSLSGYYGTPSSKEMLAKAPNINEFKAYINGPTTVLESAIAYAIDVRVHGNKSYENHSAVKVLCDWWNETVDDESLKYAKNFCGMQKVECLYRVTMKNPLVHLKECKKINASHLLIITTPRLLRPLSKVIKKLITKMTGLQPTW